MSALTLKEFKELRQSGLSTDQIIKFENGEKPKEVRPSLREGTPLESKIYTEGVAPWLHGGSTFALGAPKIIADAQGEGMREAVFPEQTTLPGKLNRAVAETAGFTVGLPMRLGAAVGRGVAGIGAKAFPKLAASAGSKAMATKQAGRLAVEGGTAGLALEPENDMSRIGQAAMFSAFGGAFPVAVRGIKGVGGFVMNNAKAIAKNVGGISDSTIKTIRTLGADKVFEPAKANADYIATNLLPRTRAKINAAITTFTPNIQRLLQDGYGVSKEAVDTVKKYGVDKVNQIRQKYNDSTDYFHRAIKDGIESKKAVADKAYVDATDSMKGDNIYLNSTLRTLKSKLISSKYINFRGEPTSSYKSGLDPQLDSLTTLYMQLKPQGAVTDQIISKDQFSLFRDMLGRMLKERPSDRFVMQVRNALYKDAERSGMTGIRKARDLEKKAFSAISQYMTKDGNLKALGKERTLDRYHALSEEQKRELLNLERFIGVKFVDELKALTSARSLDKLGNLTDENILSDLVAAKQPNRTGMVIDKYRKIIGKPFKDEEDDLMAHFANSDFNIISPVPGTGGGMLPSRSGILRSATSEGVKRYLRDVEPVGRQIGNRLSDLYSKGAGAYRQEIEKPIRLNRGIPVVAGATASGLGMTGPTDAGQLDKKKIALAEVSGNTNHKDYAQLENIVLQDLKQVGKLPKDVTIFKVKKDPKLYDQVVQLYWDRLDDFGIPEGEKALWWLMPGRYKSTGGDISKIKNNRLRKIMENRKKNMGV